MSGLENALYAVTVSAVVLTSWGTGRWTSAWSGLLAALVAMTRPDGLVFVGLYPEALLHERLCGQTATKGALKKLMGFASVFVALFGTYTAWRLATFGELVPPLLDAPLKGGAQLQLDVVVEKLLLSPDASGALAQLLRSAFGVVGTYAGLALTSVVVGWVVRKQLSHERFVLVAGTILAALAFVLLPSDWMGEFRFATPFYVTAYPLAAVAISSVAADSVKRKAVACGVGVVFCAPAVVSFASRSRAFATDPKVPMAGVVERTTTLATWSEQLGLERASVLTPDVGGALYSGDFEVVDLGGIVDPTIARTLVGDKAAFHEYVFAKREPTFIQIHGYWTHFANFHDDERFERDYVPIFEFEDRWIKRVYRRTVHSGVYVRRAETDGEQLGDLVARTPARPELFGARPR